MVDIVTPERVGYRPVPNVGAQYQPTRPIFINTPEAAFGGERAKALGILGKTLSQASDELATRANAMQELNNQATARQAGYNAMNQANALYENFLTKQGQDAGPEAFAAYQKQIGDIFDQGGKGLNPQAANYYMNEASYARERLSVYGAAHAGQQLQQFTKATRVAQADAATNLATTNVSDYNSYQRALQSNADAINNNDPGNRGPINEQQIVERNSKTTVQTLMAAADKNPIMANQLLKDPRYAKNLTGEDAGKMRMLVNERMNRFSAHNIADGWFDGSSLQAGSGTVPIEQAGYAIGMKEGSGDWNPPHQPTKDGDVALGKYGIMRSNLPSWLAEAGMAPMTPQQFIDNHDAQTQLFNFKFGQYMTKFGNFNDAASMWFTGKTMAQAGATVSDGHTTNAAYLADVNRFLGGKIPQGQAEAAIRAHADKLSGGDDPELGDYAVEAYRQRSSWERQAQQLQEAQTMNTLQGGIVQQLQAQKPMTFDELMKDPDWAAAYNSLGNDDDGNKKKLTIQADIRTIGNRDTVITPERTENFNRLMGEAYADPEGFKTDQFQNVDLSAQQHRDLLKLQGDMIQGKYPQDPLLQSALADGRTIGQLQSVGIIGSGAGQGPNKDNSEYMKFVGALRNDILNARAGGKEMSPQELQDDVTKLTTSTGPWYWQTPAPYQSSIQSIPKVEQDKIRASFQSQGIDNPTDDQIETTFAKHLYQQTVGAKSNAQ